MSNGFDQLRPSMEDADKRVQADTENVHLTKVEKIFKQLEEHAKLKTDEAAKAKYEKLIAEQRDRFDKVKDGNDMRCVNALRSTVQGTLEALSAFCKEQALPITVDVARQCAEITGVQKIAKWEKGAAGGFTAVDHIITAYITGIKKYGSPAYRKAMFLLLNQRKERSPGHSGSYDLAKIGDASEWDRAEKESKLLQNGEEFDFWKVRVALGREVPRTTKRVQARTLSPEARPTPPRAPSASARRAEPGEQPTPAPTAPHATAQTQATEVAPVALTNDEQMAVSTFAQNAERAYGALQSAGDNPKAIKKALAAIQSEANGIATYERTNPNSAALPELRALRMQHEAFFIQADLLTKSAQADDIAKHAKEDTKGFWSGLRVLNAIPKAYRAVSGDKATLTYSEAKSKVMDARANEVGGAARGAEIVSGALSGIPPRSVQEMRGMGTKKLLAAGIAKAGEERETFGAIQDFFMSPEGQRLSAIADGNLTPALEKELARKALRVEEGTTLGVSDAKWEKVGDVTSSLASLDQIALVMATGGGSLLGRLAARSALAVRGITVATRVYQGARAMRGVGLAVRAGEKLITWAPGELKALQAAEGAGRLVRVSKALARGTLSLGTSLVKFTAAAGAAEAVVPGSGHLVLAACFVIPGGVSGFSEAVGKGVSKAFAEAGGNMATAEMQNMTRAYLLYLRSTHPQAKLAELLKKGLEGQGMAVGQAGTAADAFAKDLFEGKTGRELEALAKAGEGKPGVVTSLREYLSNGRASIQAIPATVEGAMREAAVAMRTRFEGFQKAMSEFRNGPQEGANNWVATQRAKLGEMWNGISTMTGEARTWAVAQWTRLSNALESFVRGLMEKGAGIKEAVGEYLAARNTLKGAQKFVKAAEAAGNTQAARRGAKALRRAEAGSAKAKEALSGALEIPRIKAIPANVEASMREAATAMGKRFEGMQSSMKEFVKGPQEGASNWVAARRAELGNMWKGISEMTGAARTWAVEQWTKLSTALENFVASLREKGVAIKGATEEYLAARRFAKITDSMEARMKREYEGEAATQLAEAKGKLVDALGLRRIADMPSNMSVGLRDMLVPVRARFEDMQRGMSEFMSGKGERAGDWVATQREKLGEMWKGISEMTGPAREWATAQFRMLSNALENFVRGLIEKGVAIKESAGDYLAARRTVKGAREVLAAAEEAGARRPIRRAAEKALYRAEKKAGKATEALSRELGIPQLKAIPRNVEASMREAATAMEGRFRSVQSSMREFVKVPQEGASNWVAARRAQLGEMWQGISKMTGEARTWAVEQWTKLSTALENFVASLREKGVAIKGATEEYLAARRFAKITDSMEAGMKREYEGLAVEEVAATRAKLVDALGLRRIADLPRNMSVGLREAVAPMRARFETIQNGMREFMSGKGEQAGDWVATQRAKLGEMWKGISEMTGPAREWATAQWKMLSNALENFARGLIEKGVAIRDAAADYLSARSSMRGARKLVRTAEAIGDRRAVQSGQHKLGKAAMQRAEASEALSGALGIPKLKAVPGAVNGAMREAATAMEGRFRSVQSSMREFVEGKQEQAGDWVATQREKLGEMWKGISEMTGPAREWATAQFRMLSNALESIVKKLLEKKESIQGATEDYLAARNSMKVARKLIKTATAAGERRAVQTGQHQLGKAIAEAAEAKTALKDALGVTRIGELKDTVLSKITKSTREAFTTLRTDFNAFLERVSTGAKEDFAPVVVEAKALRQRVSALMRLDAQDGTDYALKPLLSAIAKRLDAALKIKIAS